MKRTSVCLLSLFFLAGLLLCILTVPDGNVLPEAANNAYTGQGPLPYVFGTRSYGLMLAGAFLLCAAIVAFAGGRASIQSLLLWMTLAVWSGLLLSRLLFVLVNFSFCFGIAGIGFLPRLWEGGFAMTGALAGMILSALWVRKRKGDFSLRALAFALPVFLIVARLGESFATTGLGTGFDDPNLFTVEGDWDYPLNVRLIEALVAVAILIVLLLWIRRKDLPEDTALLFFLILYGATQILLESLRHEGHMVWGFVKAQQIFAFLGAATGAAITASRRGKLIPSLISSVALGSLVFLMEKMLDRNWFGLPTGLMIALYALLLLIWIVLAFLLAGNKRSQTEK